MAFVTDDGDVIKAADIAASEVESRGKTTYIGSTKLISIRVPAHLIATLPRLFGPYLLVERLVTEIARLILSEYPVSRVRVRVEKPGALRFAKSVGIEIDRRRADFGL